MHVIVIQMRTENAKFNLVFKQRGFAEPVLSQLTTAWAAARRLDTDTAELMQATDDYGHVLAVEPHDVVAIFLADQQQEVEVGLEQSLDQTRAQMEFKRRVEADPKLKVLQMMMNSDPRMQS